jgi:peptidoglycan/xylan/chitin deacetylase (PgdA/CDA1 family)
MAHPQVIGRPSRMRMVERLIRHILGKHDVWIARPIEIAEHYLAQR